MTQMTKTERFLAETHGLPIAILKGLNTNHAIDRKLQDHILENGWWNEYCDYIDAI